MKRKRLKLLANIPVFLFMMVWIVIPSFAISSPPTYYPSGPQTNVTKQTLIDGGWTICWSSTYQDSGIPISTVQAQCTGDYILYAGGVTGASDYMLVGAGERSVVFAETGYNQTLGNNGIYWYLNPTQSMGFSPVSNITQSSADVQDGWGGSTGWGRLSWHTGHCGAGYICNGWRVGNITGLNWGTEYERAIWSSSGGGILPSPTPTPTPPFIPEGASVVQEGSIFEIVSPEGKRISSAVGYYGDPNDSSMGGEVSEILSSLLVGQISATIEVSNTTFQNDPAPGISKVLIILVSYEDIPVEPTPTPTETIVPVDPSPSLSPSESPLQPVEPVVTPSPTPEPQTSSPEPEVLTPTESPTPDPTETAIPLPQDNDSTEEKVDYIIEQLEEGEAVSADLMEELGLDYEDLPPDTPVELENGVILTAEVADALEIFENPNEILAAVFTDPGKALTALANVGADMTPEKREESQKVVVAAVIAGQLMNGLSVANNIGRKL